MVFSKSTYSYWTCL